MELTSDFMKGVLLKQPHPWDLNNWYLFIVSNIFHSTILKDMRISNSAGFRSCTAAVA